ncbi:MAG: glycosyltransferase [Candidatus Omnitrophica bacterium]|nr:glycosyltransferase [Candidatus Omnitrophota bacterium]
MSDEKVDLREIRRYPKFDWREYVGLYPDLEKNDVNTKEKAIRHWLMFGCREGRVYSRSKVLKKESQGIKLYPDFDWKTYVGLYSDLRKNGIDTEETAIRHWLLFGRQEGRIYSLSKGLKVSSKEMKKYPGFDWKTYLDLNLDLKGRGVDTKEAAISHWLLHGRKEGRVYINYVKGAGEDRRVKMSQASAIFSGQQRIIGIVETVSKTILKGWAIDLKKKRKPIYLDLYMDGELFASTQTSHERLDVRKEYGAHLYAGFLFELPQSLDNDIPVAFEVRARITPQKILNAVTMVKPIPDAMRAMPNGQSSIYFGSSGLGVSSTHKKSKGSPRVAIIVLNLNGADVLKEFLRTFSKHNTYRNVEVLIVDHNSQDKSREVVRKYGSSRSVKFLARGKNYSFSDSNNWAARHTKAEILIFSNNDIEFCQDVIPRIVSIFGDSDIGGVGVKLLEKTHETKDAAQEAIQHIGVYYRSDARERVCMPFEARPTSQFHAALNTMIEVPTATGAFLACRRSDFIKLRGFDSAYFYGYEDIDLCLRFQAVLRKKIVCANDSALVHHKEHTRKDAKVHVDKNWPIADKKLGYWLRRRMAEDLFRLPGYWTSLVPKIGFAVTDARDNAAAGDYFTAMELAKELQRLSSCKIIFLEKRAGEKWYDVNGLDVLIVMRDDYDLRRLMNRSPQLYIVAWARNWVDRWAGYPWAGDYHDYWASSEIAANFLSTRLARPVEVVPIATNFSHFSAGQLVKDLKSDYCFTGSLWGELRDIAKMLDPTKIPFRFSLFGYGWEKHRLLARYSRGGLPYSQMRDVYASTRIVVDDANSATIQWGSVNSRVFDALAAGALVITNGKKGSYSIFDGKLPVYNTQKELHDLLMYYLTHEHARLSLVTQLKQKVADAHTYAHRARCVFKRLEGLTRNQRRFSIKISVPEDSVREEWGDYHFAMGIKRALTRLGHAVRIDCMDQWERSDSLGDDVVMVLRGLSVYKTKSHQINIMWNVSHPDLCTDDEYRQYDHVFVASLKHAQELSARSKVQVSLLLQCTDPEVFHPDVKVQEKHEVLFVGNSRLIFRQIVQDALQVGLPLSVFGTRWKSFIPSENLKGEGISNSDLAGYYVSAGVVLNDHWQDMRKKGFISNRLFDAAACGARIVTDNIDGLRKIFGDLIMTYETPEDLKDAVSRLQKESRKDRQRRLTLARKIMSEHSFDARVRSILGVVDTVEKVKLNIS